MRLSIDTQHIIQKFGEEGAFKLLKDIGFDSIDYTFYMMADEKKKEVLSENYLEYAHYVRGLLDLAELTCNQAHAPFDFSSKTDEMDESNEHFCEIIRSIYSAAIMGAKIIIVHAVDEIGNETLLETNIRYYKKLEKYAVDAGIKIGVENLFRAPYDSEKRMYLGNRFGHPDAMREIMAELGTEHFGVCVDVGHAAVIGIEPQDYIKGLDGNLIQALHIQDNDYQHDEHLLPYMGKISWDKVTAALKSINYRGDLNFEILGLLDRLDNELTISVLHFAEKVGRKLIRMIEE